MNLIAERSNKEERVYELVEQTEFLRDLNTYFPKLMSYLWDQPNMISLIIQNTDIKDLKNYIAPLFANNFYENILSTYYIEDNLMYLLTLLLKNEINQLNGVNQNENFLKISPCGYVLEELKRKSDIQAYFKTIIFNAIQKLEVNYSSLKFKFKIENLKIDYIAERDNNIKNNKEIKKVDEYLRYGNEYEEDKSNSINLDDSNINFYRNKKQIQINLENFNKKYVPDLTKNVLKDFIEENKDNKNIYDYCYSKINDCNDKEIYSNQCFLDNLYKCDFSQELLLRYQNNFTIVIQFIDSIFENIINNFHLIPYSVKCICKIISLLLMPL